MIKKLANGRYLVDIRPGSAYGKRIRKRFDNKNEALRFEAWATTQAIQEPDAPWNPKPLDRRTLSDLVTLWYQVHGQHLRDGERRKRTLEAMAAELGDMPARDLKPADFLHWRDKKAKKGAQPKTLNSLQGYFGSMFNELARNDLIDYSSPIGKVRPIRIRERELAYLLEDEIQQLLDTIKSTSKNKHVHLVTRISLATGARWSEAEGLTARNVRNGRVYFTDTKSGSNRAVPIAPALEREILAHLQEHGSFGTSTISAFRRALEKTDIELPAGQQAHVLRHTFASYFMMQGGNILTLQRILGHASITMTMRYAHLAPDHLEDATKYNPLAVIGHKLGISEELDTPENAKTPDESGASGSCKMVETAGIEPASASTLP
ncbi:phage integrase [Marinobacter sp. SS21]|uniref:phage integrase n=1 Tax=Marinobacter sp. SS21 TaxID=2979460 RepID=UPI00232B2383|nr:tyrosine-type recombinase/integrase [Marinobacter sp. SS21]MDC0662437.1 tyrosine-type recombinase/integrase [Marinobacter sp. SS21]